METDQQVDEWRARSTAYDLLRRQYDELTADNGRLRAALKFELDAAVSTLKVATASMPPERQGHYINGAPQVKRLRLALGIPVDDVE